MAIDIRRHQKLPGGSEVVVHYETNTNIVKLPDSVVKKLFPAAGENDKFSLTDALGVIKSGLPELYMWERSGMVPASWSLGDTTTYQARSGNKSDDDKINQFAFLYGDSVSMSSGVLSLDSPMSASLNFSHFSFDYWMNQATATIAALKGKYVCITVDSNTPVNNGVFFYIPEDAEIVFSKSSHYSITLSIDKVQLCITKQAYTTSGELLTSFSPDEYDNEANCTPLGKLGRPARICVGTYTGTGTYGVSNPNSLTFPFSPRVLLRDGASDGVDIRIIPASSASLSNSGLTYSWYESSAAGQGNTAGRLYTYIALG